MLQRTLFIFILLLAGCAGAPVQQTVARQDFDVSADEAQGNRVYDTIERLLRQDVPVNVMVECTSSNDGVPNGYTVQGSAGVGDTDTIAESEKMLLLETFSKYPNFSVVDRSQLDRSLQEIKLGMNGTTVSTLQPGQISGATHLLVIEARNHIVWINNVPNNDYTEIKKLLDLQKNTALAMERYSDLRHVKLTLANQAQSVLLSVQTQDVAELRLQQERAERAEARDGKVSYAVPVAVRKIPDWQLARILKQRSPQLRDKDDGIVVRDFLKTHPGLRERVIVTKHSIE